MCNVMFYLAHARTMCMMYKATGEVRYLRRARIDIANAKRLKKGDFVRPMGVLLVA